MQEVTIVARVWLTFLAPRCSVNDMCNNCTLELSILYSLFTNDFHSILLQLGMKTVEVCRCHGITGSCNVKTCKMKTRDYEVIAQDMPARYKSASAVTLTNSQLVSVGPADDPTSNDLVYSCGTPYPCNRDEDLGIPGTSGRECNPTDNTVSNSCDRLCCGRGHYEVTKSVPVEDCVFVFCCRFDCTVVRYDLETKYYCR